ncbi:MAG: endonuclease/exonuclease/phosphatase family protein [Deltaproteobacteria bacterium]|nr:endonuclease/exonuclease/phosphatase family protein [Deltaproteobacteria bacterium]
MVELVTWNVLHRIHAVNWNEPVLDAHPDERARIAAIAQIVADLVRAGAIICLQEVSGDQLAALAALPGVHAAEHARVPHLRLAVPPPLDDPRELLVTIGGELLHAETFPTDRGKGFLATRHGDLVVVNTHVTYGGEHADQCARLAAFARAHAPAVVAGDFNADAATTSADLGFPTAPFPAGTLPTRPRQKPADKSQVIDHVAPLGVRVTALEVLDGRGLSDHNPVRAQLQ